MKPSQKIRGGFHLKGSYRLAAVPAMEFPAMPEGPARDAFVDGMKRGQIRAWRQGILVPRFEIAVENQIVRNADHGLALLFQHFAGDDTYPLSLDKAAIGTGTTAPTEADTDLETPVLSDIERSTAEPGTGSIVLTYFIADGDLANGTYREFGVFADEQLFARSLFPGSGYVKASDTDTLVEYTITGTVS